MLFANDYNDRRVHIDNTQSNQEYYCPSCGAPLIVRKGEIRQHHFAHKANHLCKDTWERSGPNGYDVTPWHNEWQSCFPENNQEVCLHLGEICHRADVLVDRTVVEFQHSILSPSIFDDRNNFYLNLGYKVVWVFDISYLYESSKIRYTTEDDVCRFYWPNPKKTFSAYDINKGEIELFFHISSRECSRIFRVIWASYRGFEEFCTKIPMNKEEFLEYVGIKDGKCAEPFREDVEKNRQFEEFCSKYNIGLSKQQERALLAVEGANLLLAVPGSGKTTVLINRIGHMILNKGIVPESILAITYTKNAAEEMRQRFSECYGKELGDRIDFRTINSLCKDIYESFCAQNGKSIRELISKETERRKILGDIYRSFRKEYATENEKIELGQYIGCIKNMMLEEEQIKALETEYSNLYDIFLSYNLILKQMNSMDYDDQLVFAHAILEKRPAVLSAIRSKYQYICVDEAQDTSKIQHAIIRLIAYGQSLFMVGDEDQSIYGFRAAFPRAMLNFRYEYTNPYILRMERNYRSTPQIVDLAQRFISKNKGRYTKEMSAERGDGEPVDLIRCTSRQEQFAKLLDAAKKRNRETAFIYRDNESSVVLIDLFMRNSIPFNLKKPEMNFFGMRTVKRIVEYLKKADWADDPVRAIDQAYAACYPGRDITRDSRMEILKMLATPESNTEAFLARLSVIEDVIKTGRVSNEANPITFSTIHSSKGLEYNRVFLVDVYDGRFPSSRTNPFSHSKDDPSGEQEERRLFYVGITRAKNKLSLFSIKNKRSSYIEELFPVIEMERETEERKKAEEARQKIMEEQRVQRERELKERENRLKEMAEKAAREREAQRIAEEKRLQKQKEKEEARRKREIELEEMKSPEIKKDCFKEIKAVIERQDVVARDRFGRRWVKCKVCGKIDFDSEFISYGGLNEYNLGKCRECSRKEQNR